MGIIPSPLIFLTTFRKGISETRCLIKVLEEYQKLGIPTGDLPNGNINPVIQLEKARIAAIFDELRENVKVEVTNDLPIAVVTPAGPGTILPTTLTLTGLLL